MKRHRKEVDNIYHVELDLNQVNPSMTVDDLREVALRNNVYLKYKRDSGLTDEAWVRALSIKNERERAYSNLTTMVPNTILNKARIVSLSVKKLVSTLHNRGL